MTTFAWHQCGARRDLRSSFRRNAARPGVARDTALSPSTPFPITMNRRVIALPLRLASATRSQQTQWICRRCLATQAEPTPTAPPPQPSFAPRTAANEAEYDPSLPSSQRTFKLSKSDKYLKRGLSHRIPPQYLAHSTSDLLPEHEKKQREELNEHRPIVGVVVSAGKMAKTVKVRVPGRRWEKRIGKVGFAHALDSGDLVC